jgi:hypothetical protein
MYDLIKGTIQNVNEDYVKCNGFKLGSELLSRQV